LRHGLPDLEKKRCKNNEVINREEWLSLSSMFWVGIYGASPVESCIILDWK